MSKRHVEIAYIKHGDAIEEYRALKGEAEWKMADSIKPYIQEIIESTRGRRSLILGNDDKFHRAEIDVHTFITMPTDKKRSYIATILVRLWYAIRTFFFFVRYRPKVIVVFGKFFHLFFPYFYAKLFGAKIVMVMTGYIGWETNRFLKRILVAPFIKILKTEQVGLILSRGKSPEIELASFGLDNDKIKIFFPEYPPEFFDILDIDEEFDRDFELFFLGRFHTDKGFMDLPEMLKKLDNKKVRLNAIGWGFEEELFKEKIREYCLENQVRIIGPKESKYVYSYLRHADILLIPTKQDTLCKVSIEGVLSLAPVVAYDIGGIKYNVIDGKTGYIIEPEDMDSFVLAIKKIIENPEIHEKMRQNAKEDRERFLKTETTFSQLVGDFIEENIDSAR
ncbi:MAG: glycosyltransferase [Candidatus Zixiibacteriota bacterium]